MLGESQNLKIGWRQLSAQFPFQLDYRNSSQKYAKGEIKTLW